MNKPETILPNGTRVRTHALAAAPTEAAEIKVYNADRSDALLVTTPDGFLGDGVAMLTMTGTLEFDLSGVAALRAALDKAEAAYLERTKNAHLAPTWAVHGLEAPRSDVDTMGALLKRTIPALNMAIRLADTTAHQTTREQLRNEVAATIDPFNPYENADMHYTPDSWVTSSARSRKLPEVDMMREQGAEIIGKAFQYPKELVGPGQSTTLFQGDAPTSPGQRIRFARRKATMTLEDTAKAMGTTIPRASDIERHHAIATDEQLAALAKLFGVAVEKLKG
jgi:hypothetical protein